MANRYESYIHSVGAAQPTAQPYEQPAVVPVTPEQSHAQPIPQGFTDGTYNYVPMPAGFQVPQPVVFARVAQPKVEPAKQPGKTEDVTTVSHHARQTARLAYNGFCEKLTSRRILVAVAAGAIIANQLHPGIFVELKDSFAAPDATAAAKDALQTAKKNPSAKSKQEATVVSGGILDPKVSVGDIAVTSSSRVLVPVKLVDGKIGSVALPNTKNIPRAAVNTTVKLFVSSVVDKKGKPSPLATIQKNGQYNVDRSSVYLLAAFEEQPCAQVAVNDAKMCIEAFNAGVALKSNAQVSPNEAARINGLLQPTGKNYAAYKNNTLEKLKLFGLKNTEIKCGPDIDSIGDKAITAAIIAEAARGDVAVKPQNIHFSSKYQSMSSSFNQTHQSGLNDKSTMIIKPVATCNPNTEGVK